MRPIMQLILISAILLSCTDNSTKQKELELKERELNLKERELNAVDSQKKQSASEMTKTTLPQTTATSETKPVTSETKSITSETKPINEEPSISGDKEKFIGSFYYDGGCPRGCDYTYVFKKNGKMTTKSESTRAELNGTYIGNWSIDEKTKTAIIDKTKYYYKFKGKNIVMTNFQYPSEVEEWVKQN